MSFARIKIKNNYEKRGDLVLRSYIRALKKAKANLLLDGDDAYVYGVVDKNGTFHELFTKETLNAFNGVGGKSGVSLYDNFMVFRMLSIANC